jgi:hypothetical protein
MGEEAIVLYVGGERQKYEAHVELVGSHTDMAAERTIIGLTRLVKGLPAALSKSLDSAKSREFNVGIQSGLEAHGFRCA